MILQNAFRFLQQVSNVVTNRPKNTGTIFVFTDKYFLRSAPRKVEFHSLLIICHVLNVRHSANVVALE